MPFLIYFDNIVKVYFSYNLNSPQFQQFEDTGSNKVYLLYVYSCLCEQYFRKEKKKKELLTKEEKTREKQNRIQTCRAGPTVDSQS